MECKKDIENLIENIDEFKEKYVTYKTKTLRTTLVKTLDYIKRKEEECEELKQTLTEIKEIAENREIFCENCSSEIESFTCDDCGYVKILQKINECEVKND